MATKTKKGSDAELVRIKQNEELYIQAGAEGVGRRKARAEAKSLGFDPDVVIGKEIPIPNVPSEAELEKLKKAAATK